MSRWRETLCGSVVMAPADKPNIAGVAAQDSEVLSCGGVFLPSSQRTVPLRKQSTTIFHLPKDKYEVIVLNPNVLPVRYGEDQNALSEEISRFDEALKVLDTKLLK